MSHSSVTPEPVSRLPILTNRLRLGRLCRQSRDCPCEVHVRAASGATEKKIGNLVAVRE